MYEDRRQRFRHQLPTVLLQKVESADRLRHRYLRDLSEGGMFIQTKRTEPVGNEIVVQLLPPHTDEPVFLKGAVVRVTEPAEGRPGGMGVEFAPTDDATQAGLRELLALYGEPLPTAETPASERPRPGEDPAAEVKILLQELRSADKQIIALYEEIEHLEEDDAHQRELVEKLLGVK